MQSHKLLIVQDKKDIFIADRITGLINCILT